MATASLVLGILSFLIGFIWYTWSGIILAAAGIICGIVGIYQKQGGLAIAGLIVSIAGLALDIFWLF